MLRHSKLTAYRGGWRAEGNGCEAVYEKGCEPLDLDTSLYAVSGAGVEATLRVEMVASPGAAIVASSPDIPKRSVAVAVPQLERECGPVRRCQQCLGCRYAS